jgi:hypothetical protein
MLLPRTVLLAAFALAPGAALAGTQATLPAGGGLGPLQVNVDLAAGAVLAGGARVPIGLDRELLPSEADVVVEDVAIGKGKHVAHVRVPARNAGQGGLAWEAILAAGQAEPIYAGRTGLLEGDPGERRGEALKILPQNGASVVVVGALREEVNICGRTDTMLDPRALYPDTLTLRSATVQRLPAEQTENAEPLTATDVGRDLTPPLARLLVATASSVPDSRGAELTDGDPQTVWTEQRPGIGQGEFVVMAAPKEVPIARMRLVVTAPKPDKDAAAPKQFFLVTSSETFAVTVPRDAKDQPSEVWEIAFPTPVRTSCLTVVLGDAYARGMAHPDVGIAELVAYSEFDVAGATLDDVAKRLSSDRGDAAEAVLARAGQAALAAAERAYPGLEDRGRARAIDVAASHDKCGEAAPLLARGMCERSGEAPRKAREKLERCREAAPALAAKLREDPETRACVAPTLVFLAHDEALAPLADAMEQTPEADRATRETLRTAFSQALDRAASADVAAQELASLLADAHRSPAARLEMMRAAGGRVAGARAAAEASLDALLQGQPPMRTRYLALGPLAELARAGDAGAATRIANTIAHDPDWPVRSLAAKLGAGMPETGAALLAAARDAEPRVREEALGAMGVVFVPGADVVAAALLQAEPWSFVREQAVRVLQKAPASGGADEALGAALQDPSLRVRAGALLALAMRRARAMGPAVRARLDDKHENAEVRAAAALALGAFCDVDARDRLTELARQLGSPGMPEDEQRVALGALYALAALQPGDLRDRVAPLLGPSVPPEVREAAQKALHARGQCGK